MANTERSVAEIEKELEEARIRERDNKAAQAEYPKMIELPGEPEKRIVVSSKEEEAQHRGQVVQAFDLTPDEQAAKANARAEADKEAAGAKSRLAGPESDAPTVTGKDARHKTNAKADAKAATRTEPAKPGLLSRAAAKVKGRK